MSARRFPSGLRDNRDGVVAVEFGLLGGFTIILLLGVLQIGLAMQSYNALRGVSADVSRHAVVAYQKGNELSIGQLETYAKGVAVAAPYYLPANGTNISVATAANQRVSGATELSLTVSTRVSSVLGITGMSGFSISHSRPIFVIDE